MAYKSLSSTVSLVSGFILAFFIGFTGWVCTKNPPLDPNQNVQESFILLVNLQSDPKVVAPGDTAVIQALLLDQANQPAVGKLVQFSTNFGSVVPTSSTSNDAGIATTIFTAPQQTGNAIITAAYDSTQTQTLTVNVNETIPQSVSLTPENTSILANGESSTQIQSVWLTEDGQPLKGLPVTFATTVGTITSTAITDSFGVVTAILTSAASRVDTVAY
ncbi:MAG: Ig-like domain-containing protein, partial [bacterium]